MQEKVKINWYRTPLEKEVMKKLMERSDSRALTQVLLQIGLFLLMGTASYLAFRYISAENWTWAVPLLIACLFFHGTFAHFMGWTATHELLHKTPFKNQSLNSFFLHLFSFISWVDVIAFRVSHVKHHQATTHHDHDGSSQEAGLGRLQFLVLAVCSHSEPMDCLGSPNDLVEVCHRKTRWNGHLRRRRTLDAGGLAGIRRRPSSPSQKLVAGHLLRAFLAGGHFHRHWQLDLDSHRESPDDLLQLAVVVRQHAPAHWDGAGYAGFSSLLPHLHMRAVCGISVLEHAIPCGASHVSRRAILQPPGPAQSHGARSPASSSWPHCDMEGNTPGAPKTKRRSELLLRSCDPAASLIPACRASVRANARDPGHLDDAVASSWTELRQSFATFCQRNAGRASGARTRNSTSVNRTFSASRKKTAYAGRSPKASHEG